MTREEAIEEIKNYNKNYPSGLSKECRDYIIKALEQEPILEKDGTLIVTTEHYKNVGRVLVECGTNGTLFYQDQEPFMNKQCISSKVCEHDKEVVLDKIRAEIEKQEKWLLQAGYNTYNVDIAFNSIKLALAKSEGV